MSKIKARNLLVFLSSDGSTYTAIAAATTCELDESVELQEVSSPDQGEWTQYIKKRKSWKVTSQHLMTTDNKTDLSSLAGTTVYIKFATTSDSDLARDYSERSPDGVYTRSGTAICTRCTVTAKNGEFVSGSFEFTGSGALANS